MIYRLTAKKTTAGQVDHASILIEFQATPPGAVGVGFRWKELCRGYEACIKSVKDWRVSSNRIVALKQAAANSTGIAYFVEA